MNGFSSPERCELALETPAGRITTAVDVPTAFVPITAIVPLARQLAAQAQQLDVAQAQQAGLSISCRKGCAACCRMLVPMSVPEVFALRHHLEGLPQADRERFQLRIARTSEALAAAGLLSKLQSVADADSPMQDEELEPLNQAYYALRLPCPFLESEQCGIYEQRPAACRELLVTSPAELCDDMAHNPVQPIPVSLRLTTALGLLWSAFKLDAPRLVPLPVALAWAERHAGDEPLGGKGTDLLDTLLDKLWRLLSLEFTSRQSLTREP